MTDVNGGGMTEGDRTLAFRVTRVALENYLAVCETNPDIAALADSEDGVVNLIPYSVKRYLEKFEGGKWDVETVSVNPGKSVVRAFHPQR